VLAAIIAGFEDVQVMTQADGFPEGIRPCLVQSVEGDDG